MLTYPIAVPNLLPIILMGMGTPLVIPIIPKISAEICFSHPGIDGFIMWGFWDGKHWADNAPLYDKDWNLKPEGEAWMQLVFDQWWTDENGNTDARGRWQTRAFLGEHRVTVTGPGGEMVQREAVVTRGRDNRVVVELAGQR